MLDLLDVVLRNFGRFVVEQKCLPVFVVGRRLVVVGELLAVVVVVAVRAKGLIYLVVVLVLAGVLWVVLVLLMLKHPRPKKRA